MFPPPTFHTIDFVRKLPCGATAPHLKYGELCYGGQYLWKYLKVFCIRKFLLYLFIQSIIYSRKDHKYLFYHLVPNPILLSWLCQLTQLFLALTVGSSFTWLLGPLDISLHCFVCFFLWALPYFLALCFRLLLCILAPVFESANFQGSLVLLLEKCIKNQELGTGHALCYWSVFRF